MPATQTKRQGAMMWKYLVTIWILGGAVSGTEVLDTFKKHEGPTAHDLKSGPIELLDTKTIKIPNFFYDGNGSDTFWIVGYGKPPVQHPDSIPGFVIPNEHGKCGVIDILLAYTDATIQLVLPGEFTVNNVDWLAMYDITEEHTFGWIDFAEKRNGHRFQSVVDAPAGTVPPELCQQRTLKLPTFKLTGGPTAHDLKSDPLELLNVRTIRIPNLNYDGTCPDAYWMVGNGEPPGIRSTKIPGNKIPNENGNCDPLKKYSGETVELVLPDKFTVNNINWLAMYCITAKHTFGWVDFKEPRNGPAFLELTPLPRDITPPKPCEESKEVGGGGSGQSKLTGSGLILLGILVPVYGNCAFHF